MADSVKAALNFHQFSCSKVSKFRLGKSSSFHLLDSLPDSVLLNIFVFLAIKDRLVLRRVCKRWSELLYDFSLWRKIDLNEDKVFWNRVDDIKLEKWILRWGDTIQALDLSECKWLTDKALQTIARKCRDLRNLNIEGCFQIADSGINEISKNCLSLQKVNIFLSGVSDVGLDNLVQRCTNLDQIKLGSRGNSNKMIASVCRNCTALKNIAIHDVIPFDELEPVVDDEAIWTLARCYPQLQVIDLTWCCFLSDDALVALSVCCPHLTSLLIRECHQVTDNGIICILQTCHRLTQLHVERLYNVTDRTCDTIQRQGGMENLHVLKIIDTSITDYGIAKFAETSPKLKSLLVGEYCFNPNNIIGKFVPALALHCKGLKRLYVFSGRMSDPLLITIAHNLQVLEELFLGDCRCCTKRGLMHIIKHCCWLRYLNIQDCAHVTSTTLALMAKFLPSLRILEVPGCGRICPKDVTHATTMMPHCQIRL